MGKIRKSTLLKLIAQIGSYRIYPDTRIEAPPAELTPRLLDALPQIGELLESDEEEIREQALGSLARVWQVAPEKVLPLMMENLGDLRVFDCARILAGGLAEGIPTESLIALLIGYLAEPNSRAGEVAARALATCGPAATAAIPALLEIVGKHPTHVWVALALWRIGQRSESLPGLIAATRRLYDDDLLMTIRAIEDIGPGAAEAGPALLECRERLKTWRDSELRESYAEAIADALGKIGSMKMRMPGNELIEISPPVLWPGRELSIQPGDFGDFSELTARLGGSRRQPQEILRQADVQQVRGGVIYFVDDRDLRLEIPVVLAAMGVRQDWTKYAVFVGHASDPKRDGYLAQVRIVTHFGLYRIFEALTSEETLAFPAQPLSIADFICGFVEKQREEWESLPSHLREQLRNNILSKKEELGFGFMVEEAHYGVYRLWSRPWLNSGNPIKPFKKG